MSRGRVAGVGRRPVLGLAALVAVVASVLLPGPSRAAGGTHLRFWAATNGGGQTEQSYTTEQAVVLARTYDVLVALKSTFDSHLGAMRAANPRLKVIAYHNGIFDNDGQADHPSNWYLRDASGSLIRSDVDREGVGDNILMNPANAGVQDLALRECQRKVVSKNLDGCYFDSLGAGNLNNLSGRPINPATGNVYTATEWLATTTAFATTMNEGLSGTWVAVNGLNNGGVYFGPDDSSRLLLAADAGNAEGWLRGAHHAVGSFRSEADWERDVHMLVHAGRRGKSVIAMTKVWVSATSQQLDALRRYVYASFLLGTNGNQFLYFNPGSTGRPPSAHRYDRVDIGSPLAAYAKVGGVYQRPFTGGLVVVNPTDTTKTIDLVSQYRTLDEVTVSSLTLTPNTGEILRTV